MSESSPQAIYAAITAIMAEVTEIPKTRKNQTQNYSFRGIDDAYNALQGPMTKNGVFVVPKVVKREREERQSKGGGILIYTILDVEHTFYAKDGSSVTALTIGEAMDSGDKSSNKAMSAALKYALLEVFCIPTVGDNDTENHSPEPSPKQPPASARPPMGKAEVVSLLSMEDVQKASTMIDDAFKEKKFSPEGADAILGAVLVKQKLANIKQGGWNFVNRFIQNIVDGKYDKMKNAVAKGKK